AVPGFLSGALWRGRCGDFRELAHSRLDRGLARDVAVRGVPAARLFEQLERALPAAPQRRDLGEPGHVVGDPPLAPRRAENRARLAERGLGLVELPAREG